MKKKIALAIVGLLLFVAGMIAGGRLGYTEADKANKFRLNLIDAQFALTNYSNHKEVLQQIQNQNVAAAIDFTTSVLDANKKTVIECLSWKYCKELIGPEVMKQAPELIGNTAAQQKAPQPLLKQGQCKETEIE
jgi:hypothetical protein